MGVLGKIREAVSGGPTYTAPVSSYASTSERDKNARVREREARQAAARRGRHKAAVVKRGDDVGIPFGSEPKRRFGRR
ncbi:hypothetical protein [[Kitasatospora] papulosa]|uniref:hypothetical protein n=1 Tax=[Kitasatospora] papulosa TaxID=1464011 RepID=UPI003674E206